jgi:hypothetical protein
MGRAADSWGPGDAAVPQAGRPDDGGAPGHLGDPESDPYVVDPGLEPAPAGVHDAGSGADTGPLVRPGKEAAA